MISAEQLISNLQKENAKLKEELASSEQNIKDFERLAQVWKKSYQDDTHRYKVKIANLEQTIEELTQELEAKRQESP